MPDRITIPRPDDWHVHLREGDMLPMTVVASARCFGRCVAMPNLATPLTTASLIAAYGEQIKQIYKQDKSASFKPLLTMYLTDESDPVELIAASKIENFFAVKYYPRGATTNSKYGVSDINKCSKFLEMMQELAIPLLIHGESVAPGSDVFDREKIFIDESLIPLRKDFPGLKITLEHVSSKEAATYIKQSDVNSAATITPQHLMYNRNHMLHDGIRPHLYCKPILKREEDRQALVSLIKEDFPRVFLGSDSAPHKQTDKESLCGCAGVFSSPYLLEIITHIFAEMGQLETADKLINFVSINGAKFYGFPPAEDTITLVRQKTKLPSYIELANNDKIIPLGAGEMIHWAVS